MRNSPINNIRNNRDYISSPYESAVRSRSPPRDPKFSPDRFNNSTEAQYWRQRAKSLQTELLAVNEELLLQIRKNQKIDDLQDKIQLLLAQNTHFVDENQNLIRLVQQKNSQIQIWKKKFDSQYTHSNIAQAQKKKVFDHLNIKDQQHQYQVQKLVGQISRLQDQIVQIQNLKQIEMNQLKNKYQNESMNQIQNLKRSQYGNNQLQELNIRKLKDTIQEKNFEIQNLRRESKLENQRLNGQISFLKNEIKKLEHQKDHQLDLINTQNENAKNNLIRAHRKTEEELKNLHEAKVKRLNYELQERKNQVEELGGKLRKGGKQNQNDLNRLAGEKNKMRIQLKQNDNRNRERITELTTFYESQLNQERATANTRQTNLSAFYQAEINSLKEVIAHKQAEIKRLLELNIFIKQNQEKRLADIRSNNDQLKQKIEQLVMHYEREVQLMKIKVSQLYEADLESLKSKMRNSLATHNRQTDNLRDLLKDTRQNLAKEAQDKLDLRKDYEFRLNEFNIKYQREHQQLQDLLMLHQKQIQNQTSKASLTHIGHNQVLQNQNVDAKKMMNQKRALQTQINNKNKQIQALNLRIQKMVGFQKREVQKLEQEINKLKQDHQQWLQRQDKQTNLWNEQRAEFKQKIHKLSLEIQAIKGKAKKKEDEFNKKLQQKTLRISYLEGEIHQYNSKVGVLHSKNKVQVQNVQKTYLQTQSLMNNQKDKFFETSKKEKHLVDKEFSRQKSVFQSQIDDIKRQNELLRDNYQKSKIREEELKSQIGNLLDSVNQRSKLEEHVINIGLSNNYFKNVAEIFKKSLRS